MSEQILDSLGQTLRERYDIGDHIYATRTSEAAEGVDLVTKKEVCFWTLRHPLAAASEAEQRYLERLRQIEQLFDSSLGALSISKIHAYGVERSGVAYCVTDYTQGDPLSYVDADPKDLIKFFRDAVAIVAQFHRAGLNLGDICEDSFLVEQNGNVRLIATLGSFEIEAKRTAALPPGSTLPYIAPEQRSGAPGDFTSDIFSLGMLGYRVITGRYPFGERIPANISSLEELLTAAPAPSLLQTEAPPWIDDILGKCLEIRADNRYRSAEELLSSIDDSARSGYATDGGGRWARRTVMVKPKTDAVLTKSPLGHAGEFAEEGVVASSQAPKPQRSAEPSIPAKFLLIAASGLALGVLVAGMMFVLSQDGRSSQTVLAPQDFAPPELRPALADLRSPDVSVEQKLIAVQRLAESDNPVSYASLVQVLKEDLPAPVRQKGFELLAAKLNRQGMPRAGDVFKLWVENSQKSGIDPTRTPAYAHLTRAGDITLPPDARKEALHKAFAEERDYSLHLAGALALDDSDPDRFVPVLRQLLTSSGSTGDLAGKSVGAMLAADRILSIFFDKDIEARLPDFSNADLAWAMTKVAELDTPLLLAFANEAVRRKVVPPYQEVFLKALAESDRYSTPRSVRVSLVRGAQRLVDSNDVTTLAQWLDLQAEPTLLAICAMSPSEDVAVQAFDSLAVRSLRSEPARSLFQWVKTRYWDHRKGMVTAIGILSLNAVSTQAQVEESFNALMPFSTSGSLLEALIKSGDGRLIQIAIDRLALIIPTADLIKLLDHPDSNVRISAVKSLSDRNDITELQKIIRSYEREKDEQVRQNYRDHLWVIRNREKR